MLTTVPPWSVFCKSGIMMPAASVDGGPWRLESAEISARELIDLTHACATQAGYEVTRERLGELIVEAGAHQAITALT